MDNLVEQFFNLFIFSHPFFPSPKYSAIPIEAIAGIIFIIYIITRATFSKTKCKYKYHKVFVLLCVWILSADFFNLLRIPTFSEFRHVAGRILSYSFIMMTYYMVNDESRFYKTMRCLLWGVVSLANFTVFCALTGIDPFGLIHKNPREFWGISMGVGRTQGVPISYGEYGLMLNAILPVFLVSLWKKDFFIFHRKWALIGLSLLLLGLIVSQSRNSWLATFFVFNFFGLCLILKSNNASLKGFTVTLAAVISVFLVLLFSDYFFFVVEGFVYGQHAHSFVNRIDSDKIALKLFFDSFFFGVGHQAVTEAIGQARGIDVVVHNGYMDQLASTGLFGFIPFISLMFLTLNALIRIVRTGVSPWCYWALCLAASFIANMSLLMGYKGFFSETMAIEYGLTLCIVRFWEKSRIAAHHVSKNLPFDHYLLQPSRQ